MTFLIKQVCAISAQRTGTRCVAKLENEYELVIGCVVVVMKTMTVFQGRLFDLECTVAVKSTERERKGEGLIPPCSRSTISAPEIHAVTAELRMPRVTHVRTHSTVCIHSPIHMH